MADTTITDVPELEESKVDGAIAAFETMLEVMPSDRALLEVLVQAYQETGDTERARGYCVRLAQVLVDEKDEDAAIRMLDSLRSYAEGNEQAQQLVARIEKFKPVGLSAAELAASLRPTRELPSRVSMADELALAWNLLEAEELTQEEYASVAQDLSEMFAGDTAVTVSVLHVLEGRGSKHLERVMSHIARHCGTPLISVSSFTFQAEVATLLPVDFMVRCGVMVFDLIGKDALAVVMNPCNSKLCGDLETYLDRRCHFFVTPPSEFDRGVDRIAQMLAEGETG